MIALSSSVLYLIVLLTMNQYGQINQLINKISITNSPIESNNSLIKTKITERAYNHLVLGFEKFESFIENESTKSQAFINKLGLKTR